jgi:hypothetical protein
MLTPEKFYRDADFQGNTILNAFAVCKVQGYLTTSGVYIPYPSAKRGDVWVVQPGLYGLLGGATGQQVGGGDVLICHAEESLDHDESAAGNWTLLRPYAETPPYQQVVNGATSGVFNTGFGNVLMDITALEGPPYVEVGLDVSYENGVVTWSSEVAFVGVIVCKVM